MLCFDCGTEFQRRSFVGRPPRRCAGCAARAGHPWEPRASSGICAKCGDVYDLPLYGRHSIHCPDCRNAAIKMVCRYCGRLFRNRRGGTPCTACSDCQPAHIRIIRRERQYDKRQRNRPVPQQAICPYCAKQFALRSRTHRTLVCYNKACRSEHRLLMRKWQSIGISMGGKGKSLNYYELLGMIAVSRRCANEACRKLLVGRDRQLDHDHASGRFRGFLCGGCNAALGHVQDNVERLRGLADYLAAA